MTEEEGHNFVRDIVCVKFPGIVKDTGVDKALQTLGGTLGVSNAVSNKSQRLELNFSPKTLFHKPVQGDRDDSSKYILLKVKKSAPEKAQIVGLLSDCYTFKSLCEFQFLPPPDPDTSVFPINSLPNFEEIVQKEVPTGLYLPAHSMSRIDSVSGYFYSNRSNTTGPRPTRKNSTQRVPFKLVGPLPSSPLPGAYKAIELRKLNDKLPVLQKFFEDRPIWTKSAMEGTIPLDKRELAVLLPCVAFFFLGGPWRLTWCRHGYDPRSDPSAGIWQTLEFRAQSFELRKHLKLRPGDKEESKFRDGNIPPHMNNMYQMVDIELTEVQTMLISPHYKVCHEKYGWVAPATFERVRKIIDEKATEACIQRFGYTAPEVEEECDSDDSLVVLEHQQQTMPSAGESDSDSDF